MIEKNGILRIRSTRLIWLLTVIMYLLFSSNSFAQNQKISSFNVFKHKLLSMNGQNASSNKLHRRVHLEAGQYTLKEIVNDIARQSGLRFSYSKQLIPLDKEIDVKEATLTTEQALWAVLKGTSLRFGVSGSGQLFFFKREESSEIAKAGDTITGTVVDAKSKKTLPGVNILVKGTSTGASTDANGNFEVNVPSLQDTLVVSFIGYKKKEVPINGRTKISIRLVPATISGEELVVVGYGEQRKISLVGSQSSLTNEQVGQLKHPTGSLTNSLAGRLSGVVGVQRSGLPGSDASDIWIRGISTFNSSGPLVLVDGIERPMNSLNPDDIKSLTILKDASATAVYGTRGANGVILIKTKRGTQGSTSVNVNFYQGVTELTKTPDIVDGPTFMRMANEASTTRGGSPVYTQEEIDKTESGENPLLYPNVDWIDQIFNDYGENKELNASISGGSDIAQYRVSLSWYNERGLIANIDTTSYNTNSKYNKYNLSSNVTVDITPNTQANLGVGGYLSDKQYPDVGVGGIYGSAIEVSPVEYPVIYPGGRVPGRNSNGGNRNPFADATTRGYSDQFLSQLFTNLDLTQDLDIVTPGLSLHGLFGFDTYNDNTIHRSKRLNTYYINPQDPYDVDGSYNYSLTYEGDNTLSYNNDNSGNRKFYIQGDVRYEHTFNDVHDVSGLIHYSQSDFVDASAGDLTSSLPHREQSIAGRIRYSYDNRYFIEFDGGYTGSEQFAPTKQFGFFPSAGIGWVPSNEKFWEPISNVIQYLKIRYTNGYVGADDVPGRRFAYLDQYSSYGNAFTYGRYNGHGRAGLQVGDIGVNAHWATARKQDLGIELRTLHDNLTLTVDFFKEHRKGIFLDRRTLPNFVGLTTDPKGNYGVVDNKGFDGQISYNGNLSKDFSLSVQGKFTYNRDKIIDNDQPPQPYPWLNHRGDNLLAVYGYIAEGYFEDQDDIDNHARQFGTVLPGDIKYKDLNGDGKIDAFDQAKIGRGDVPYLTLGFTLNLGYKAFDVGAFFQGQFGADRYIYGSGVQPFQGDAGKGSAYEASTNHWTVDNPDPNAAYPRLGYGAAENTNNYQKSSFWERDIDFVRMRTCEFGYTLPVSVAQRTGIRNARIFFRGRNLLTFSNFHLWDPELNTHDGTRYPNTKVYSLGFELKF